MRAVSLIDSFHSSDSRGNFVKILKCEDIRTIPQFNLEEVFFTTSHKGAVRGMHLQVGLASNWRFIQVLRGNAFDVLLDLRQDEETFLQHQVNFLSAESPQSLIIPPGIAHGFQALTDVEIIYITSHRHDPELDRGVNPFSIGVDWPIAVTSISARDTNLPTLEEYIK